MNKYVRVLVVYGIPNLHTDHLITYLLTCAYLLYPQSTAFMVARRVTEEVTVTVCANSTLIGGVVDIGGRRDFSRFDPSPWEAPL